MVHLHFGQNVSTIHSFLLSTSETSDFISNSSTFDGKLHTCYTMGLGYKDARPVCLVVHRPVKDIKSPVQDTVFIPSIGRLMQNIPSASYDPRKFVSDPSALRYNNGWKLFPSPVIQEFGCTGPTPYVIIHRNC